MKRPFAVLLAACVLVWAGCALSPFSNKKPKPKRDPKQGPHVSLDVELEFRQRWVDKRASDLIAQGMLPDSARDQALAEFKVKYAYTKAANMPMP
jgi:hypothetical protein